MAEVDIKELEREAKKKEQDNPGIKVVTIDGKDCFKGPYLDKYYSSYDECVNENTAAQRIADNKAKGLDEYGRTPEQIAISERVAELLKDRAKIVEKLKDLDNEIGKVQAGKKQPVQDEEEKEEKKSRRKK